MRTPFAAVAGTALPPPREPRAWRVWPGPNTESPAILTEARTRRESAVIAGKNRRCRCGP